MIHLDCNKKIHRLLMIRMLKMSSKVLNSSLQYADTYKYLVVGAGPAGLACASTIKSKSVLVVDLGKSVLERDRFHSEDCVQGAGGAGLFSDGKFSFYPAGTEIWKGNLDRLQSGYKALEGDFNQYGEIPRFPEITTNNKCFLDKSGWQLKPYPSLYLSLEDRMDLITKLANRCPRILYETEFLHEQETEEGFVVKLKNRSTDQHFYVKTNKLVLAGGRFMPLFFKSRRRFRRYEFGFRIAGPSHLFKKEVLLNDPKYIFFQPDVEYRTFCWCDRGEVVKTSFKGIESFSGRSDCTPTESSNFGFNIRVKNTSLLAESDFRKLMTLAPFEINLKHFVSNLQNYYPVKAAALIDYGLSRLLERFSGLKNDNVSVIGPTIEGVGDYPAVDENFRLEGTDNVSVIGDSGGSYRGIIPSMLSGYCLAHSFNQQKTKKEN